MSRDLKFDECLRYLYGLGNEVLTMKFGLDSIRLLVEELGRPHERFPSVLIAGTNGKGSVSRFLSSIASASGLRTGLFTSPHLIHLQERIRVDGRKISGSEFAGHFSEILRVIQSGRLPAHPTFFECVTATALSYFAAENVDLAVLEIGMGGRLDSTNVVEPILSVITPISYDHQQYLGNTLTLIALEKAGIMRKGKPVLISSQFPEAEAALLLEAERQEAIVHRLSPGKVRALDGEGGRFRFQYRGAAYSLRAAGRFQVDNAALALRGAELLHESGLKIKEAAKRKGIESTVVDGVLQVVSEVPLVLVDGGHNPASAHQLREHLREHTREPRALFFGSMRDKAFGEELGILDPLFEKVYLVQITSSRAATIESLMETLPRGIRTDDLMDSYRAEQSRNETIVVAGSFLLAGQFLSGLENQSSR